MHSSWGAWQPATGPQVSTDPGDPSTMVAPKALGVRERKGL